MERLLCLKESKRPVDAPTLEPRHFHLFLSHVWGPGQDQMRIVKQRLLEMVPDARVFLECVTAAA